MTASTVNAPTTVGFASTLRPRRGVISRLDYLAWLGIDAIWLTPITVSPDKDMGYDVADYCDVQPAFGDLAIVDELIKEAEQAYSAGVRSILLFGIPETKDEKASAAYAPNGPVQKAVRELKREVPEMLLITDVCLCEYMSHGHCGILEKKSGTVRVLNDPTLKLLAQTAQSHAEAGADIVAPSDMMDGRVQAIRQQLDGEGFSETPIMSYAAKFASAFYGPFREAAEGFGNGAWSRVAQV